MPITVRAMVSQFDVRPLTRRKLRRWWVISVVLLWIAFVSVGVVIQLAPGCIIYRSSLHAAWALVGDPLGFPGYTWAVGLTWLAIAHAVASSLFIAWDLCFPERRVDGPKFGRVQESIRAWHARREQIRGSVSFASDDAGSLSEAEAPRRRRGRS